MKFIVRRASGWDEDVCPCEGATRTMVKTTDIRKPVGVGDMNDFYARTRWFAHGTNHRVLEDGRIARDLQENKWIVTIKHLKHLIQFIDEHDQVVISYNSNTEDLPEIMIYDDYIE